MAAIGAIFVSISTEPFFVFVRFGLHLVISGSGDLARASANPIIHLSAQTKLIN
jgi:hypothetical protein